MALQGDRSAKAPRAASPHRSHSFGRRRSTSVIGPSDGRAKSEQSLWMRNASLALTCALTSLCLSGRSAAQQVASNGRSILQVAQQLKPGEFVWAHDVTSEGPALVVVNL